ncbi:hypothetical protein B0H16DRAFT_1893935 [Mycena metata]|uniref:Uncharacterized protein n=1 Tax=Mycena metata TaxID=1033252 RepID=A0AAD7HVB4_9AGAR|nr:hypothetical protein B0H16DRAFT_1893935 [Mycena metata]
MSTTTTITLASVAKAREEAKRHVATALPDDQSKAKAADDLINKLNNPEVKKQAHESVKSLAKTIRDIRKGFISVADALVTFDSQNFTDQDGNVLSLGKEWKPLIVEFDTTLQFSLVQATDAVVMLKTVQTVLGDVTEADGKDLAAELRAFMKQLGPKEAGALEMKNKFQKLAEDVILFNVKIDIAAAKADAKIKGDLDNARTRLASLTQELETWNQTMNASTGEIIGALAVGAGQAALALFSFNFFGMMSAISTISGAISNATEMKKKAECEQSIELVNQEINNLLARDQELGTVRTRLEESKKIVASVSTQILIIVDIWRTINQDMHSLDEALSSQLKGNPVITKLFLKKLGVAKEIYHHLTVLLETYVEQTNAANPTVAVAK